MAQNKIPEGQKLQKVMARAGIGSRRACEEIISQGRVSVNGTTAKIGTRLDPAQDEVRLDGFPIPVAPDAVYLLLNKPVNVLSTASDDRNRPTVMDYVDVDERVFPVGRLDWDSEGLIILTNDGEFANHLMHPSHEIEKEYLVEVDKVPSKSQIKSMQTGVEIDGVKTKPARVSHRGGEQLEVVLAEGRNRQVRRMCEEVGLEVERLVRTRIGPLRTQRLKPGSVRALRPSEVQALYGTPTG